MNERLNIDYFPGYDYVYVNENFKLVNSWLISKYKVFNYNGELLPIEKWIVEQEWISIKSYPILLIERDRKINKFLKNERY